MREAHARFAQAPALNDLCERSFNATDRARIRDAFATLMLCQYASERQQRANAIPGNRADALKTLAAHLSPTGADRLKRTLNAHAEHNAFSQRLTQADRHGLIGHIFLGSGVREKLPGPFEDAASAYEAKGALAARVPVWQKTAAYTELDLHADAAQASKRASRGLAWQRRHMDAAGALSREAAGWERAANAPALAARRTVRLEPVAGAEARDGLRAADLGFKAACQHAAEAHYRAARAYAGRDRERWPQPPT